MFLEGEICGFLYNPVLDQIWYFLLTRVIKKYKTAYNMDYDYCDLVDLKDNYAKPEFRLKVTYLPYLMRAVKEAGLDLPVLNEIIAELNYFLER